MKKTSVIFLLMLMMFSVIYDFSIPVSAGDIYKVEISGICDYGKANEVLKIVNAERSKAGLIPLTMDTELLKASLKRAMEISLYFNHIRPDGRSCFTVCNKINAENIASDFSSAKDVMNLWMNSNYHKINILDSSYKSIGICCFKTDKVYYWVQCFSTEPAKKVSDRSGIIEKCRAVSIRKSLISSSNVINKYISATRKAMKNVKITELSVMSKSPKKINIFWKKVKKVKGYQVQISTDKKFKKSKIVLTKSLKKNKLNIKSKKLKSKKTYYVRVRAYAAYKDKNGKAKKVYSMWNKKLMKVKVK